MSPNFIEVPSDKFHEFILDALPKHHSSQSFLEELNYRKFHTMDSFKKNFINEILNNYYGIHFIGSELTSTNLNYKFTVTNKKLCTFFLLKYGS
jgi:hypothetical protein